MRPQIIFSLCRSQAPQLRGERFGFGSQWSFLQLCYHPKIQRGKVFCNCAIIPKFRGEKFSATVLSSQNSEGKSFLQLCYHPKIQRGKVFCNCAIIPKFRGEKFYWNVNGYCVSEFFKWIIDHFNGLAVQPRLGKLDYNIICVVAKHFFMQVLAI